MSFRTPPNKGVIQFPCVLHVRCTQAMLDEIQARGGGQWVRSLVEANSRPPADTVNASAPRDDERENVVNRLLVCDPIDDVDSIRRQVAGWSMSQLKKATAWAQATHYAASDNDDVEAPKMPACVRTTQKGFNLPPAAVSPAIARDTSKTIVPVSRKPAKKRRRVSLDKKKRPR